MLWEIDSLMNIDTIQNEEEYYHELQKAKWREYSMRPEVKLRRKITSVSLKAKEYQKEYWKKPEVKERKNELNKEPKNKERIRNYDQISYALKRIIKESYLEPIQEITNTLEADNKNKIVV